ncbi:MAG TPA: M23 family metallopeptidase [Gemmatimonadaceae bacterium]|nr:M23 family metallopeptidase [Gemmatimonadaceae bacterium]
MAKSDEPKGESGRGYGNIYTPHAGAMIIHVQRESGLANRTLILSAARVRFLRIAAIVAGVLLLIGVSSWFYLATQAARVPYLTRRLTVLERDVQQLDTLKRTLAEVEGRFQQVQQMLGASGGGKGIGGKDSTGIPDSWPLPVAGQLLDPAPGGAKPLGIEVAVPRGTQVKAAGSGTVIEVRDDPAYGRVVRLRHALGYESVYGNLLEIRVTRGQPVAAGAVIALSGDSTGAAPAHLHFEIVRDGVEVNPAAIVTKGPQHGDLQ